VTNHEGEWVYERRKWRFSSRVLKKTLAIGMIVVLIAITFQAMIPLASGQEEIRILRYGTSEILDSGNPYVGILDISYIYFGMIYDYLTFPNKDLVQTPNLACSWWKMDGSTAASQSEPTDFSDTVIFGENNSDTDWPLGSIWEYNLTENVFWNDGTPFTADDVVWTFNIQIGDNFQIYWAYQPTTVWMHHTEKVNDYKVRVFFSDHLSGFPFPIAFGNYMSVPIMAKHFFEDKAVTYLAYDWDGVPALGTGPFMGTANLRNEILASEFVTLVKNPYYDFIDSADGVRKGLGGAYNRTIEIDKLILKIFSDRNTLHLGVLTGQIDTAIIESGTYLKWKSEKENGTLSEEVELVSMLPCTGFSKAFCLNDYEPAPGTLNALRLDPAVQRAAAIATNKSFIIKSVFSGLGVPGTGIISTPAWPEWWWEPGNETSWFNLTDGNGDIIPEGSYSKPMKDVMEFDLDLANDILDAAGYVWTGEVGNSVREAGPLVGERMQHLFGMTPAAIEGETLEFEMVIDYTDQEDKQMGIYVSSEWKNIGIVATPELVDSATWSQLVYSYTYNVQFTYWSGDVDPNYLCYITTSMSIAGWNDFGIADPEYDNFFYRQAKAQNYTERKHWVDECTKYQYLSGNMITTCYPKVCYAYRTDTWTNWGNWTEHIGLGIDHFWGEAPIFYQIKYNPTPPSEPIDYIWIVLAAAVAAIAVGSVVVLTQKKKKKMQQLGEREAGAEEEERES